MSEMLSVLVPSIAVSTALFAAVLGVNPVRHLLARGGALSRIPAADQQILTGRQFFPELISGPFHQGLLVVFTVAAGLAGLAAIAWLLRGGRYLGPADAGELPTPVTEPLPVGRARPASTAQPSQGGAAPGRSRGA